MDVLRGKLLTNAESGFIASLHCIRRRNCWHFAAIVADWSYGQHLPTLNYYILLIRLPPTSSTGFFVELFDQASEDARCLFPASLDNTDPFTTIFHTVSSILDFIESYFVHCGRRRMQNGRTRFRCSSSCHYLKTIQCLPTYTICNRVQTESEIYQRGRFSGTKSRDMQNRTKSSFFLFKSGASDRRVRPFKKFSVQGPYLGDGICGVDMVFLLVFSGAGCKNYDWNNSKLLCLEIFGVHMKLETALMKLERQQRLPIGICRKKTSAFNAVIFQKRNAYIYLSSCFCWLMAHAW